MTPKVFLIVLDGFGDGKDSPFNAIQHAHMPFYKGLCRNHPRAQLITCGTAVGRYLKQNRLYGTR